MKHCPITYEEISENQNYSKHGLKLLSQQLEDLSPLEYSANEQRQESIARAGKMSIQGVQPKLSARLNIRENKFEIVDKGGYYILKPQTENYPELPENEALTMSLASLFDLDVPVHGLVYSKDNSMTYFIKRFDRQGRKDKIATEDFSQLLNKHRDTKYEGSMEKVIDVINKFCSFPRVELLKLLKLILFIFLTGNEDMHLKNFSMITEKGIIKLSPFYDLLNTTIALRHAKEELALSLNGKKNNLQKKDFFEYLGKDRLQLNSNQIEKIIVNLKLVIPKWRDLIHVSFLSNSMKKKYIELLNERANRLGL